MNQIRLWLRPCPLEPKLGQKLDLLGTNSDEMLARFGEDLKGRAMLSKENFLPVGSPLRNLHSTRSKLGI